MTRFVQFLNYVHSKFESVKVSEILSVEKKIVTLQLLFLKLFFEVDENRSLDDRKMN